MPDGKQDHQNPTRALLALAPSFLLDDHNSLVQFAVSLLQISLSA
jgi:hypothetical protein